MSASVGSAAVADPVAMLFPAYVGSYPYAKKPSYLLP